VVEEEPDVTRARDEILDRIRAVPRAQASPAERTYRRVGRLDANARVDLFAERVADYRAEVRVIGPAGLPEAIVSVCAEHGATRVGIPPGLPQAWRSESVDFAEDRDLSTRDLDALGGVVTGCTVAVGETGTIVLAGGPAEGRRALTLVPDLHVCVVRSTQIVELVPEAIGIVADLVARERRPLTFVSGPSATSDIEFNRIEGVHGPRTLIVLIVKEEKT
jgi:L-lactate dehydrogenase complex protein LldG